MKLNIAMFSSLLHSSTLRQSSITSIGTIINGMLGAVFYILLAIFLGPASFGIFTLCVTTLTLVADIGDFGTNTGLVNFISRFRKADEKKAFSYMKLGLLIKLFVSTIVIIGGWLFAPFIAVHVFLKPDIVLPLQIAMIGVSGQLLLSFVLQVFQAYERFYLWTSLQIVGNTIRLILVITLFYIGYLSIETSIGAYVFIPLLSFVCGFFFLPIQFIKVRNYLLVSRSFFNYNVWVALFAILAAISARLDTFISGRLLSSTDLGIYGLANQMVTVVPQLVGALGTVIAPKMANQKNVYELINYLKKTQFMVLILACLGIFSIPAVFLLLPILGTSYQSIGPLFVLLLLSMLVFLISVPAHQAVFHYFEYPKLFVWVSIGNFLIIAFLGWYLIQNYGIYGAAFTVLLGNLFNFLVPTIWVLRKIRLEIDEDRSLITNH